MTLVLAAAGVQTGVARLRRLRPSGADTALGAAAVKEGAHVVAGDWSRRAPFCAGLIAFSLAVTAFGPGMRRSWHFVVVSFHDVRVFLHGLRKILEGASEDAPPGP